jgi:hypothetical protein
MPVGTPLTAPADGVVVHKNRTASAGFNLILRHEGTWHTVYYHLQKPSHLALGATVKTGEVDCIQREHWGKHWATLALGTSQVSHLG